MDIVKIAQTRHTCKAYDSSRQLNDTQINQLKALLQASPSSVNSQPWHFIVAATPEARTRIGKSTASAMFSANAEKVKNASVVFALCAKTDIDDTYLDSLLNAEEGAGRFTTAEQKLMQKKGRSFYTNLHKELKDVPQWLEKQVYIALGTLLLGAGALGIDATPIEGFDSAVLDAELGLAEKGLKSVVLVAAGYRSQEDFNAALPKARRSAESVFTEL